LHHDALDLIHLGVAAAAGVEDSRWQPLALEQHVASHHSTHAYARLAAAAVGTPCSGCCCC
jgi:hypothetical protein